MNGSRDLHVVLGHMCISLFSCIFFISVMTPSCPRRGLTQPGFDTHEHKHEHKTNTYRQTHSFQPLRYLTSNSSIFLSIFLSWIKHKTLIPPLTMNAIEWYATIHTGFQSLHHLTTRSVTKSADRGVQGLPALRAKKCSFNCNALLIPILEKTSIWW